MSTEYDVRCLDCGCDHGFENSNHNDKEMRLLASMGPLLAKLCETMLVITDAVEETPSVYLEPQIRMKDGGWYLNLRWWTEHGKHNLVMVDEYGRCDDECAQQFRCSECQTHKFCKRTRGHDGQHADKRDDARGS